MEASHEKSRSKTDRISDSSCDVNGELAVFYEDIDAEASKYKELVKQHGI